MSSKFNYPVLIDYPSDIALKERGLPYPLSGPRTTRAKLRAYGLPI